MSGTLPLISVTIEQSVMRSASVAFSMASPVNSTARKSMPPAPRSPTIFVSRSLMQTPFANFPTASIFIVSGTRNQFIPAMYDAAISELPTPVAKAPTAPSRFMWLSVPSTTSPGFIIPASSMTCCPMP